MLIHQKRRVRLRRRRVCSPGAKVVGLYVTGSSAFRIGSAEARKLEIEYGYAGRLAAVDYNRNLTAHVG